MDYDCSTDPFVARAKEILHQMSTDSVRMAGNSNQWYNNAGQSFSQPRPQPNLDFFTALLNSWQQSNQNLQQQYSSVHINQQQILNTVFKFEPDHFKMLVDVRGYSPQELNVVINTHNIEIRATHEQMLKEQGGAGYANRTIMRTYDMPFSIMPERVVGNLLQDGTLFIAAPWD